MIRFIVTYDTIVTIVRDYFDLISRVRTVFKIGKDVFFSWTVFAEIFMVGSVLVPLEKIIIGFAVFFFRYR